MIQSDARGQGWKLENKWQMMSDLNVYLSLSLYTLFASQISCLQTFMLINLKSQNGSSKEQSNNQIIIKQNEHIKNSNRNYILP